MKAKTRTNQPVSGGTKLYKHTFIFTNSTEYSSSFNVYCISTRRERVNSVEQLANFFENDVISATAQTANDSYRGVALICQMESPVDLLVWYFSENNESIRDFTLDVTDFDFSTIIVSEL